MVDLSTWGIPKIISIGNLACRPNIETNSVLSMIILKDVSRVRWENSKTSAQLFCTKLLDIESMTYRVKCIPSVTELPCDR